MFRIEINAAHPAELHDAIRALAGIVSPTPAPLVIEVDPVAPAPADQTEGRPRRRSKKDETVSNTEPVSTRSTVGIHEIPKDDGSTTPADPQPADTAVSVEENSASQSTVSASQEEAGAGNADPSEEFDTTTRDGLKGWLIRHYLHVCFATEPERPAAFKALMQEVAGVGSLSAVPDADLPKVKALADQKIEQFIKGAKR